MRWLALLVGCAALCAFGEEPADFSASAPVTPANADALQRFVLPFDAYRDARRDLADVRVFNANGEPVPIALAGEPDAVREAPRSVLLPLYPVSSLERASTGEGAEVTIRTQDGTLVEVHGRDVAAKKEAFPVAYLLDASRLQQPLAALRFHWDRVPGAEVVPVTVEASDDLQAWWSAGHATLWRLRQGESDVSQVRAELVPASRAKYYRITWSGARVFRLHNVHGEYEAKLKSEPRESVTVEGRAGEKPGEFVFDLGARLPVEAVRVVPAERNSIASFKVFSRDPPDTEWHHVTDAVFYRLERGGHEIESGPAEIGPRSARGWMVLTDPRLGGVGTTPPKLEAQWRSAEVVFVARGAGPFRVAFGDRQAKPAWVSVAALMPDYQRGDELKLPLAAIGPVEGGPPRRVAFLPERFADIGPRKLTLWATLILAVAILGFMAWRLHRQMAESRK